MKNSFLLLAGIVLVSCTNEPEEMTPPEEVKFLDIQEKTSGNKDNFKASYDISIHSGVTHDYYLTVMTARISYENGKVTEGFTNDVGIDWKHASYFNHRKNQVTGIPVYAKKISLTKDNVQKEHLELKFPLTNSNVVGVEFRLHPVSESFEKELLDHFINIDFNNTNVFIYDTASYRQLMEDYADLEVKFPESPVRAFILSSLEMISREMIWINTNEKNPDHHPTSSVKTSIEHNYFSEFPGAQKYFTYEVDPAGNIRLMDD